MTKTKIVVIQKKELIYTAIFAGLGIFLILLLVIMFFPSKKSEKEGATGTYNPGVYTSQIALGDATLNLEIVVDSDQIKSLSLINLEDSVATMYPLVKPALTSIEEELKKGTAPDDIVLSEKSKYTETLLIEGVKSALNKALADSV